MSGSTLPRLKDITEGFIAGLISAIAAKFETEPEHWVGRADESLSYCLECCEAEVEKLNRESPDMGFMVDGGWSGESDSQPFCETCGKPLAATFTTYACESELDHFEDNGFDLDSPSDCYSMERILGSVGFLDDELTPRIKRVISKALKARKRKCPE